MKLDFDATEPTGRGEWGLLLTEFMSSKMNFARVVLDENKNVHVARRAALATVRRHKLPVKLAVRKGELYLFRLEGKSDAVRP